MCLQLHVKGPRFWILLPYWRGAKNGTCASSRHECLGDTGYDSAEVFKAADCCFRKQVLGGDRGTSCRNIGHEQNDGEILHRA